MRFRALDSLRGIAAVLVALVHLSAAGYFYQLPIIRHAGIAVPLFFVLSGFVISHAYTAKLETRGDIGNFILRRVGRIYPLHLFTLLVLVVIEIAKFVLVSKGATTGQQPFTGDNSLSALLANVFLLHAVIPFGRYTWNGPSWSISVEMYTNILFALVLVGAERKKTAALNIALLVSAVLLLCVINFTELKNTSGRGLADCMFGFMCGNFAYRWHEHLKATWRPSIALEGLAALMFLVLFWYDPVDDFFTLCGFAVVVFLFSFERGPVSKILTNRVFLFLGKISYSIYLIHYVILSVLYGVLRVFQSHFHQQYIFEIGQSDTMIKIGPTYMMDFLATAYIGVVLLAATICYSCIEEPGRELFNRASRRISNFRPSTKAREAI